jgi:ATP-dependent DNA helicase RecQ
MQFKAGYIADSIAKVITEFKNKLNKSIVAEQTKLLQINGLLQYVSSFEVEFPYDHKPNYKNINPVLATINNIISRGLPTRASIELEELFSKIGLTETNKDEFELNFPKAKKEIEFETLFQLLHIVEPKLEITLKQYGGFPGSFSEWKFLDETLKEFPFAKQILQSQRNFSTIDKKLAGGRTLDFSYEFPYKYPKSVGSLSDKQRQGIIFEFDGPHHKLQTVKFYDNYRDNVADENNFETLRQSFDTVGLEPNIEKQFKNEIFEIYKTNYNRVIKDYLTEYNLLFIPLAVARIQKTLLEFLIANPNEFEKKEIKIAIIERDLPCGAIAIKSLQSFFDNINEILEDEDKLLLPIINITIFENKNWVADNSIHLNATIKNEEYFKLTTFDIVIDHSILRRSNIYKEIDFNCENAIKIRSSHYFDTDNGRKIYCSNLLNYKSLVEKKDDGSYIPVNKYEKNINFFIQNIFRKVSFRDGQLPIISRALQQKPVIGLLPTGGGKSLTFQLPTFLQPGLCLVVDPIKSLMEDQVRVLKENWIDCCDFINSNLSRQEKLKKLIDFRFGETMFLFVSPERFVMEDFRNIISKIDVSKFSLGFSYCVIDEVHCVSEWGHDFRSTYLMLGKNAQKFATTASKRPVSLIGLTATASFDVLADIERELQIKHDDVADAIIMIENTIRPELFFRIIDVTGKNRIDELNIDFQKIGKNLSKINNQEILLLSQKHHFNEFGKKDFATLETKDLLDESKMEFEYNSRYLINEAIENKSQNEFYSIVFCPVKGEMGNQSGVNFVYENLNSNSKGFFYASDNQDLSTEVQTHLEWELTKKTFVQPIIIFIRVHLKV